MAWPAVDRKMGIRLRAVHYGLVAYALFLVPLGIAVAAGIAGMGWPGFGLLALAAALATLVFHLAIRSGWSTRFRDPSLTLVQVAVSAAIAAIMVRYAGAARGVLLMLALTGFAMGMLALSRRQMLALTVAIASAYLFVILVPEWSSHEGTERRVIEVLRFLTLTGVLAWFSIVGGHVSALRGRLVEALARVRALASHDELTGVYNRRHLMEILGREKERATRYGHPFAVAIIDIDDFKQVNDTHGHDAGDEVLRAFAQRLREHSRSMDWVAREQAGHSEGAFGRYGGEEFLMVLPHAQLEGACSCMERLRAATAEAVWTSAGPLHVTFSAGVAVYRPGEAVTDALKRADAALYRAKDAGRNRIEPEPDDPVTSA